MFAYALCEGFHAAIIVYTEEYGGFIYKRGLKRPSQTYENAEGYYRSDPNTRIGGGRVKAYRHPQIFFLRAEISQLNALDEPTIYWYN